jgi:hypothetical protein
MLVRVRKLGHASPSAIGARKIFNPLVTRHPWNMRSPRLGSSQFCCHNQTDPLPALATAATARKRRRAVSANRQHLPVWGSKLPTNWLPRPPRRKSRPKSSAALSLAKSSAPGHHHTDNERDGERLERCLPNQLG